MTSTTKITALFLMLIFSSMNLSARGTTTQCDDAIELVPQEQITESSCRSFTAFETGWLRLASSGAVESLISDQGDPIEPMLRFAGETWYRLPAGDYFVTVRSPMWEGKDDRESEIITEFVAMSVLPGFTGWKGEDDDEIEVVAELKGEDDDDEIEVVAELKGEDDDDEIEVVAELAALCDAVKNDDVSDTLLCAESMRDEALGTIEYGDVDVIRFTARQWTAVEIRGEGEIVGRLLDAAGRALEVRRAESAIGFHWTAMLSPGTYYVRLEAHGFGGDYRVATSFSASLSSN